MVINNSVDLTNNYASLESFKSSRTSQPATNIVSEPAKADTVEVSESSDKPKEKKSFIRRFKDGFAAFKKFFIGVGEYAKGTVKGLVYGGVAAGAVLGVDAIKGAARIIKDAKAGKAVTEAAKVLSTKGKIGAGVVGLAILGYQLFKASLNATEKKSDVDHRWGSGHNKA